MSHQPKTYQTFQKHNKTPKTHYILHKKHPWCYILFSVTVYHCFSNRFDVIGLEVDNIFRVYVIWYPGVIILCCSGGSGYVFFGLGFPWLWRKETVGARRVLQPHVINKAYFRHVDLGWLASLQANKQISRVKYNSVDVWNSNFK